MQVLGALTLLIPAGYLWASIDQDSAAGFVALLAGLIGAFSELVPIGKLDDNFVFPVLSATLLTGLLKLFGGL